MNSMSEKEIANNDKAGSSVRKLEPVADSVQPPYVFASSDEEGWMNHLDNHGYCVLREALESKEVEAVTDMIWRDMGRLYDVERTDPSRWEEIPTGSAGIISKGLPQTEGPWTVRSNETIRKAFNAIWKTDDLLVSMDSLLCWLPWNINRHWKPFSEGLHLDQNPFAKPDRICVQGMVPLLDVTEASGGLEVIHDSHTPAATTRFMQAHPQYNRGGFGTDWCPVRQTDHELPAAILLMAKSGDLILWDSRTVHGGRVGTGTGTIFNSPNHLSRSPPFKKPDQPLSLARLAVTVCMTPKILASSGILKAREKGFKKGCTFTHWPHEAIMTAMYPHGSEYVPVELSARAMELIH